ncbi:MAG: hypothetical protein ABI478_10260 [Propionivibrio sp.]
MASELITSWGEHGNALTRLLLLASKSLCVFDQDLEKLRLEDAGNAELFQRFLAADSRHQLQIAVRNAAPMQRNCPRLMRLLALHAANISIIACPDQLSSLNDSLLIVDDRHTLIRFHQDHARGKIIVDSPEECAPYVNRFADIVREGGDAISATTLGL